MKPQIQNKITINDIDIYEVITDRPVFEGLQTLDLDADTIKTLKVERRFAKRKTDGSAYKWRKLDDTDIKGLLFLLKNPGEYISPEQKKEAYRKETALRQKKIDDEYQRKVEARKQREKDLNNPKLYKNVICRRCNGKGYILAFMYVENGRCYSCNGTGYKKRKI